MFEWCAQHCCARSVGECTLKLYVKRACTQVHYGVPVVWLVGCVRVGAQLQQLLVAVQRWFADRVDHPWRDRWCWLCSGLCALVNSVCPVHGRTQACCGRVLHKRQRGLICCLPKGNTRAPCPLQSFVHNVILPSSASAQRGCALARDLGDDKR